MTKDEAKKCVKKLGGLFPGQLTQDQAEWALKRFLEFEYADVVKAIDGHRESPAVTANKGFIEWTQLMEGCRAAARAQDKRGAMFSRREGSWADIRRRQRPDLAEATDAEVVMRIHRGWWLKWPKTDGWRAKLHRECAHELVNAGVTLAAASIAAEAVFGEQVDFDRAVLELNFKVPRAALPAPALPA